MKRRRLLANLLVLCLISPYVFAEKIGTISYNELPRGAQEVIAKIKAGSADWPFPKNDNKKFGNRERRLPADNSASYREYTVCTEGMKRQLARGRRPNRGAKRIIYDVRNAIFYYTDDHYGTFRRVVF